MTESQVTEARLLEAKAALAKQLQEGLDSGPAIPITKEWLKQQRAELLSRLPYNFSGTQS